MIILMIVFFVFFKSENVFADESNSKSSSNSNEPIVVTTYYREPHDSPLFSLIPQYDKKIKRTITYTGLDKDHLPEITFNRTYVTKKHTIDKPKKTEKCIEPSKPLAQETTNIRIPKTNKIKEDLLENTLQKTLNICRKYKYPLLACSTVSIYCLTWWQLSRLSHAVYLKNSWSCWKNEIPLEILYDMPQQEVRTALITMINETYKTEHKDISDPLLIFKKDIHYEIECLQHFINFYRFFKRTFLSYIFPSYEKAFKKAQEKIDRLMYLEELIEDTLHDKYMI